MTYKLGVLVTHGIGDQKADFADGLIGEVTRRLGMLGPSVCWEPVHWAPVFTAPEATLLAKLKANSPLDGMWLRRIVVHYLADAVAYQRVPSSVRRIDLYEEVHQTVAKAMHSLREKLRRDVPLVVLAHSLGGHIMSNHIWDLQRTTNPRQPIANNPFEKAETVAGIVTFGCNIPLFTLAYNNMVPIKFPATNLASCFPAGTRPEDIKSAAKWLNLYDPDDALGYPLKPLSDLYGQTVTHDLPVNVGNLLTSWNPLSHGAYWTDNDVTKPIANLIEGLLKLL
jgi:hypothetical protein